MVFVGLFIISTLLVLTSYLIRIGLTKFIKKRLSIYFANELEVILSTEMFGIKRLRGSGEFGTIRTGEIHVNINFLSLFGLNKDDFLNISLVDFYLEITEIPLNEYVRSNKNLETWIYTQISTLVSALLVKSLMLTLSNIVVKVEKNTEIKLDQISVFYRRSSSCFNMNICLDRLGLSHIKQMLYIDSVKINLDGTVQSLKYILSSLYKDFSISTERIRLSFVRNKLVFSTDVIKFTVQDDSTANGSINVEDFVIRLPVFNLYTTNIQFLVNDMSYSTRYFKAKHISLDRDDQCIFYFPNFEYEKLQFNIDECQINVPLTLIIDISTFTRFFLHQKDVESRRSKFEHLISKFVVNSPKCTLNLNFSDNHQVILNIKHVSIVSLVVQAKKFTCDFRVKAKNYHFAKCTSSELNLQNQTFGLSCNDCLLELTDEFPENVFIQDFFAILSFISRNFKDFNSSAVDMVPPTKRELKLNCENFELNFKCNKLIDMIDVSNEAKLSSVKNLIKIQKSSIPMLNDKPFTGESFEKLSKNLLFQLFKESISKFSDYNNNGFTVKYTKFSISLNGKALPNRQAALDKCREIYKEANVDTIGRVFGGFLKISATYAEFSTRRIKRLFTIDDQRYDGWFIAAKHNAMKRSDFFHMELNCDNNRTVILIPQVCARPVHFINGDFIIGKLTLHATPVYDEFKQDMKLFTTIFRAKRFKCQRIRFIDFMRLRNIIKVKVRIGNFITEVIDKSDVYSSFASLVIKTEDMKINLDTKTCHIESNEIRGDSFDGSKYVGLFTLPPSTCNLRIVSYNNNSTNTQIPLFIPHSSYKINKPSYDPFQYWRTHTFSVHAKVVFDLNKQIFVDLGQLQTLMKFWNNRSSVIGQYIVSSNFVLKPQPYPVYSFFELETNVPSIRAIFGDSTFILERLNSNEILKLISKDDISLSLSCSCMDIMCTLKGDEIFRSAIRSMSVQTNDHIKMDIDSIKLNFSHEIFLVLLSLNFSNQKKKNRRKLDIIKDEELILNQFRFTKLEITVGKIDTIFRSLRDGSSLSFSFKNDLIYKYMADDDSTFLNTILVKNLVIEAENNYQIASLDSIKIYSASGLSNAFRLATLSDIQLSLRPENFKTIIPAIRDFCTEFRNRDEQESIRELRNLYISLCIKNAVASICDQSHKELCNINVSNMSIEYLSNIDRSGRISFVIDSLTAIDSAGEGKFRTLISPNGEGSFLRVTVDKTKRIMKYPVVEKIKVEICPLTLGLSVPYINSLKQVFPKSEDLKMLDIDNDEVEENEEQNEQISAPESSEKEFFCREFVCYPVNCVLSIRRKEQGAFSEFLDRPFSYNGLHIFDTFVSFDKIMTFGKKSFNNALWKSMPGLILGRRGRKATNILPKAIDGFKG